MGQRAPTWPPTCQRAVTATSSPTTRGRSYPQINFKGQCHGFFHESVSPKPLSIPLGPFQIFSKIRGEIRSSRFAAGIVDTGGKFATGVNNTREIGCKISRQCRWYRRCILTFQYLREFSKKFEIVLMEYSGAGGKLIHEKNKKQKISWHCPFKGIVLPDTQLCTLQRDNTEYLKQIFPGKELRGCSPNSYIHVSVSDLYIPLLGLSLFFCRKKGGPNVGIYRSRTDTWMWKLGTRPRNSFSKNRQIQISFQCRLMVFQMFCCLFFLGGGGFFWEKLFMNFLGENYKVLAQQTWHKVLFMYSKVLF